MADTFYAQAHLFAIKLKQLGRQIMKEINP